MGEPVRVDRGGLTASESELRRSLSELSAAHGPQSIEVARRMHELARLLASGTQVVDNRDSARGELSAASRRERLQEAHIFYEHSLAIKRRVLGSDDPEVAVTLHDWALLCQATGKHNRARALWTAAEVALGARRSQPNDNETI